MFRIIVFSITMLFTSHLFAMEHPFTNQAFDDLQQQGAPIVVFIHADWCPTCNRQATILSELFTQAEYQSIELLRIDFDHQKAVVKDFGAKYQSTLILFRGDQEIGRSTADTEKASIARLLKKVL